MNYLTILYLILPQLCTCEYFNLFDRFLPSDTRAHFLDMSSPRTGGSHVGRLNYLIPLHDVVGPDPFDDMLFSYEPKRMSKRHKRDRLHRKRNMSVKNLDLDEQRERSERTYVNKKRNLKNTNDIRSHKLSLSGNGASLSEKSVGYRLENEKFRNGIKKLQVKRLKRRKKVSVV